VARALVDEVLAPADSETTAMRATSEATAGAANAFCLHGAVLEVRRCSYFAVYSPRHSQHPLVPG
jgi:hypothetical protein